ncbi:hypothetical protein LR48_Vigan05g109700 [Vigna angularis]|uniref:Uncharacterized protein n=1 Tax=Phaseolus angularis TaxID=3914 RepID=A0A0L9UL80_PHAAN|nr:hypothetical protein LR48_Vigan05g109700 [Vigna angularis]
MVRRWLTAHGLTEAERRLGFQWVEDDAHVLGLRWRVLIDSVVSARISGVASSEWFNLLVVDCHMLYANMTRREGPLTRRGWVYRLLTLGSGSGFGLGELVYGEATGGIIMSLYGEAKGGMIMGLYGEATCGMIMNLYGEATGGIVISLYGETTGGMIMSLYGEAIGGMVGYRRQTNVLRDNVENS